jgi:hypothetical protein
MGQPAALHRNMPRFVKILLACLICLTVTGIVLSLLQSVFA